MNMLAKIAWRNIWRNPRRSWVLITAIAVGVFSFLGGMSYIDGFMIQMVDSSIEMQGGHIQITQDGYFENPRIRAYVDDVAQVEAALEGLTGARFAPEVTTPGMINSAEQASGVQIHGVDPEREGDVSGVPASILDGTFLTDGDDTSHSNDIVIGAALADRLNVRLGEKVVLMANDLDNEIGSGAYRVAGLFRTTSSDFDKTNVYLPIDEARRLLGYGPDDVSVVSVDLAPGTDLEETAARIEERLSGAGVEVLTWRDRAPLLVMMQEMYDYVSIYLVVILFAAIAFTIVNSFLMVIFERIREIGIMSANGVRPRQIRWMLYLEAVFILALGMLLGGALAAGMIAYWSSVGLDLTAFAEGLSSFGASSIVYPYLHWGHIATGFVTILIMVLLAVLYPAFKASRFEAVEAINYT